MQLRPDERQVLKRDLGEYEASLDKVKTFTRVRAFKVVPLMGESVSIYIYISFGEGLRVLD